MSLPFLLYKLSRKKAETFFLIKVKARKDSNDGAQAHTLRSSSKFRCSNQ